MAVNSGLLNSHVVNGLAGTVVALGIGEMVSFEQQVAIIGVGEEVSFEQVVNLRISTTASEEFISFEQVVRNLGVGTFIPFEQRVIDSSVPSHLDRTGWDLTLVVGGYQIPSEQIVGMVDINRTESDAALMNISILPPTGIQNIEFYHGKSVTLDVHTDTGINRVFTGTVDIPEVDITVETITLRCSDKRTEQLNAQLGTIVDSIGVYSSAIFRAPRDTAELVEQRLTTTPHAVDFDAYGNYTFTPWAVKATPDFTLADADVYYTTPEVEFTSRGRVTNKITLNFQYRYQRFYHATRIWRWTSPINNSVCLLLKDGYSLTSKSMVRSAADSAGWPISGNISFTDIHPGGWYRCDFQTIGWSPAQSTGEVQPVLDEKGKQLSDAKGNLLYKTVNTGIIDYSDLYCMGATWSGTKQWSQNVTENYTLTVQAPQSQTQFGNVEADLSYSLEHEVNTDGWENYDTFRTVQQDLNYYIDQDLTRNESNQAMDVALQQARNTIVGSHRDTRVIVRSFLRPDLDLKHTILVATDELQAKGKVFNLSHKINIGTGEATTDITLVLSRATGSSSNSALTIPAKPSDNVAFNTDVIVLGNHFGEDPTTIFAKGWNGMIGNKWESVNNDTHRTNFIDQFVVDTPAVPDNLRESKELDATSSYNVEIPNDTLIITFDGIS